MRLSEAIRLGAMTLPEAHGPTFTYDEDGNLCGACAIGAALYAATGQRDGDFIPAYALWDWVAPSPRNGFPMPVVDLVILLFEHSGWTREKIARWVETVEPQPVSQDVEAVSAK